MTQVVQWLKQQCDACGMPVRFHSLTQPTQEDLLGILKQENNPLAPRLQPGGGDHPIYSKFQRALNPAELSNYERHRTALEVIQRGAATDYHLVLEDDIYILPIFEGAWRELLLQLREGRSKLPADYFALFSMTQNIMTNEEEFHWKPYASHPLTETHPLIPSKEVYMVHPKVAAELYQYMTVVQCDMRQTLSRWMYSNMLGQGAICFPSKRLAFDGSKLGMFPSSIHANNLLIYNQEFMEMLQLMSQPEKKTRGNVLRLYRAIERLNAPDAIHLYAVLMYQLGDFEEAGAAFKKAIEAMNAQGGFMSRGSEMLHNAIEFYKHSQKEELDAWKKMPSKYAKTEA